MDKALGSNPYDVPEAVTARERHDSYRSDGSGLATQSPLATPLFQLTKVAHTHRNKLGRFSAEHDCAICQNQTNSPPFSVPSGFSVIRTDQGGWTITPLPLPSLTPLPLPLLPIAAKKSVVSPDGDIREHGPKPALPRIAEDTIDSVSNDPQLGQRSSEPSRHSKSQC